MKIVIVYRKKTRRPIGEVQPSRLLRGKNRGFVRKIVVLCMQDLTDLEFSTCSSLKRPYSCNF